MHAKLNEWDVFSLLGETKAMLVTAYDRLQDLSVPEYARRTLLVGLIITLASIREGFDVLREMCPELAETVATFDGEIAAYVRLRHDAAHVFDRLFREPRKNANDPWIVNGAKVLAYDPSTDVVSTGDDKRGAVKLFPAIVRTFEMTKALEHGFYESKYGRSPASYTVAQEIEQVRARVRDEPRT